MLYSLPKLCTIFSLLAVLSWSGATAQADMLDSSLNQVEIRVMPEAVVYNEKYELGDIAELDGFDIDLVEKLSHIVIGHSPMPGKSVRISSGQIKSHLRGMIHPKQFQLIMPRNPLVSRASIKVEKAQLTEVIITEIKKSYAQYDNVKVTLQTRIRDQYLPKGELNYRLKRIGSSQKIGGAGSWALRLEIGNKLYRKLIIRAKVEVIDEIVVANGVIPKGSTIGSGNLKTVSKDISNESKNYTTDSSLVVGQQARRDIRQNEAIKSHLVEEPVVLVKGQPVTLVYETETMYLSNKAIALRDGKKGEVIPLRIVGNKRTVYGLVISSKRVEVAL